MQVQKDHNVHHMYVVAYCISIVSGFFGIMATVLKLFRSVGEVSDKKLTRSATSDDIHEYLLSV